LHDETQDDLARRAGVTLSFLSAIERGAHGLDVARLRRVAAVMGTPPADLLADPNEDGHPGP
jgi:transcriptional regulator with XRE-family HTH domain